jgi:hypothetical protein
VFLHHDRTILFWFLLTTITDLFVLHVSSDLQGSENEISALRLDDYSKRKWLGECPVRIRYEKLYNI